MAQNNATGGIPSTNGMMIRPDQIDRIPNLDAATKARYKSALQSLWENYNAAPENSDLKSQLQGKIRSASTQIMSGIARSGAAAGQQRPGGQQQAAGAGQAGAAQQAAGSQASAPNAAQGQIVQGGQVAQPGRQAVQQGGASAAASAASEGSQMTARELELKNQVAKMVVHPPANSPDAKAFIQNWKMKVFTIMKTRDQCTTQGQAVQAQITDLRNKNKPVPDELNKKWNELKEKHGQLTQQLQTLQSMSNQNAPKPTGPQQPPQQPQPQQQPTPQQQPQPPAQPQPTQPQAAAAQPTNMQRPPTQQGPPAVANNQARGPQPMAPGQQNGQMPMQVPGGFAPGAGQQANGVVRPGMQPPQQPRQMPQAQQMQQSQQGFAPGNLQQANNQQPRPLNVQQAQAMRQQPQMNNAMQPQQVPQQQHQQQQQQQQQHQQPQALTHQAAISQAQAVQAQAAAQQKQQQSNGTHGTPSYNGGQATPTSAHAYTNLPLNEQHMSAPGAKFQMSKSLTLDPRVQQPAPGPPSRPTLANQGMLQQPGVQRAPTYVLEGEGDHVLSKRKLDELVRQVTGATADASGESAHLLAPDVEESILEVADEFVDNVITAACRLAKLRPTQTLDIRDVQLVLERNYGIRIPGYSLDEVRTVRKFAPAPGWHSKMQAIQATKVMGSRDT